LRTEVKKTYKQYVGGAFVRSESGRTFVVDGVAGSPVNGALGSRKDARDAVVAARRAFGGWSGATAYNRGQVLYRVAEMMESRASEFGPSAGEAIDQWVWYAGWTDKLAAVLGTSNPVAGPFVSWSAPEPTGVVAVLAPSSLPGLVSVLAPVIATGCTAVLVAPSPVSAMTLAEVLAVSDVPAGVVNILTGRLAELGPPLASHMDVNAIDVSGAPAELAESLVVAAADNLKRVVRGGNGIDRMRAYLELKTIWHPVGS